MIITMYICKKNKLIFLFKLLSIFSIIFFSNACTNNKSNSMLNTKDKKTKGPSFSTPLISNNNSTETTGETDKKTNNNRLQGSVSLLPFEYKNQHCICCKYEEKIKEAEQVLDNYSKNILGKNSILGKILFKNPSKRKHDFFKIDNFQTKTISKLSATDYLFCKQSIYSTRAVYAANKKYNLFKKILLLLL